MHQRMHIIAHQGASHRARSIEQGLRLSSTCSVQCILKSRVQCTQSIHYTCLVNSLSSALTSQRRCRVDIRDRFLAPKVLRQILPFQSLVSQAWSMTKRDEAWRSSHFEAINSSMYRRERTWRLRLSGLGGLGGLDFSCFDATKGPTVHAFRGSRELLFVWSWRPQRRCGEQAATA